MFSLLVLSLFLLQIFSATSECPPYEVVKPCDCGAAYVGYEIFCGSNSKNLKNVFTRISDNMKGEKRFEKLEITSNISEIEANLTKDVKFDVIKIDSSNLQRIHSSAFQGTAKTVKRFFLKSDVSNLPPPYNVFDLMNSFTNLKSVFFYGLKLDKIPSDAIDLLPKLKSLTFFKGQQKSPIQIYERAFYQLDSLFLLGLEGNKIDFIHPKAFQFDKEPEESLQLQLSNNSLTSLNLNNDWLNNINRQAIIWLDSNEITYLDRDVFKTFLNKHDLNEIVNLIGNPLNCYDCRNAWLVKEKDKNGNSFKERIKSASCNRIGDNLFDQKFEHCK